jgi:hypothetical protein
MTEQLMILNIGNNSYIYTIFEATRAGRIPPFATTAGVAETPYPYLAELVSPILLNPIPLYS